MIVKALRLVGAVVLAGSLLLVATRATATASPSPIGAPCSPSSLTSDLSNVTSVEGYGCAGPWAYLWATLSASGNEFSVTELMSYASGAWRAASRATYCHPGLLPDPIYHLACFSN